MIRTILSKNYTLHLQAGAGIVAKSIPQKELEEVNSKLEALKLAIVKASDDKINTVKIEDENINAR
jgi:anthranilate synthase component 1